MRVHTCYKTCLYCHPNDPRDKQVCFSEARWQLRQLFTSQLQLPATNKQITTHIENRGHRDENITSCSESIPNLTLMWGQIGSFDHNKDRIIYTASKI